MPPKMTPAQLAQMGKSTKSAKAPAKETKSATQSRTTATATLLHMEATGNDQATAYFRIETVHNGDGGGFVGAVGCGPNYVLAPGLDRKPGSEKFKASTLPDISVCKLTSVKKDVLVKADCFQLSNLHVTMGSNADIAPQGRLSLETSMADAFGRTLKVVQSPPEVARSEFRTGPVVPWKQISGHRETEIAEDHVKEGERFESGGEVARKLRAMRAALPSEHSRFEAQIDDVLNEGPNRLMAGRDVAEVGGTYLVTMTPREGPSVDVPPSDWYYETGVGMASNQGLLPAGYKEIGILEGSTECPSSGSYAGCVLLKLSCELTTFDEEKIKASWDPANLENGRPDSETQYLPTSIVLPLDRVMAGLELTRNCDALTMVTHVQKMESVVALSCKESPRDLWPTFLSPDVNRYCKHVGIPVNFEMVAATKHKEPPIEIKGTDKVQHVMGGAAVGFQCLTSNACHAISRAQAMLQKQTGYVVRCVGFVSRDAPGAQPNDPYDYKDPKALAHDELREHLGTDDLEKNTKFLLEYRGLNDAYNRHNVVFYSYVDFETEVEKRPEEGESSKAARLA